MLDTLHAKLTLSHTALLLAILGVGALSLARLTRIVDSLDEATERHTHLLERTVEGMSRASETSRLTYEAVLAPTEADSLRLLAALDESRTLGGSLAAAIRAALPSDRAREAFAAVEEACAAYGRTLEPVRQGLLFGRRAEAARIARTELVPLRAGVQDAWKRFAAFERAEAHLAAASATRAHAGARAELLLMVLGLVLAGAVLAFLVTRSVSRAVLSCASVAQRIATGDLREGVAIDRADELGDLQRAMMRMADRLRTMVDRTRAASRALSEESARNWASARDLLGGTTAQRSTMSDLASRLTDMGAGLANVARLTSETEALAAALPSLAGLSPVATGFKREVDELWSGLTHVTRGLIALEDVAKRNASMAGQLWEHAEAAASEARSLQDVVEAFQTGAPHRSPGGSPALLLPAVDPPRAG